MPIKLMYITNNPKVAQIADSNGVDWIFIDLEVIGKKERQGNLDTVQSQHSISDIAKVKLSLTNSQLLVRTNPIHVNSKDEINQVINNGADILMLPYFKTKKEVELFIKYINGRAKVCLLCETAEAVENIDEILKLSNIDYIHIGLNDLHLAYKQKFMFEPLADGTVENICNKIKTKNIKYGFGGMAKIGEGTLPAELILSEHYRLQSSMVILARAFCDTSTITDLNELDKIFNDGVKKIREYEEIYSEKNFNFEENKNQIKTIIKKIIG